MNNKLTRKTNTVAKAVKAVAVPAKAVKAVKAVAVPAKAVKAAVSSVDPVTAKLETLANMIRGMETRIAELETVHSIYQTSFESFERVLVAVQTTQAKQQAVAVPAVPVAVDPVKAVPVPAVKAVAVPAGNYAELIDSAVDSIIEGINANRFAIKVIPQCENDLRAYASPAIRKAIKAYRDSVKGTSHAVTLAQLSQHIVDRFEVVTEVSASTYTK